MQPNRAQTPMRHTALFLVSVACFLVPAAHSARPQAARSVLQSGAVYSYNSTATGHGANIHSYNVSISQQNATLPGHNMTVPVHNITVHGHNATGHGHGVMPASPSAAAMLPPQHLFQHGRKCGLDNITHSDRRAAGAVKIHSGLAEGEVSIVVQVRTVTAFRDCQRLASCASGLGRWSALAAVSDTTV